MKNKIQISIPTPCHENWQNMTITEKGRFCASCQKNVIDFTKSSDREILKAFDKNNNLCGRFNDPQLNRDLFVPKEKNTVWITVVSGVLAFLGVGTNTVSAQLHTTEQTDNKTTGLQPVANTMHEIRGTVKDSVDVLPGVSIIVKGTTRGTQTDFDGNYTIIAGESETLVFSYIGCLTQEIIVGKNTQINPTLKEIEFVGTMGVVVYRRRTFFGRIFHSIGNLFR